jgi:hypothetical protein
MKPRMEIVADDGYASLIASPKCGREKEAGTDPYFSVEPI